MPGWEVRGGFNQVLTSLPTSFLMLLVLLYIQIFKTVSLSFLDRYGGSYFSLYRLLNTLISSRLHWSGKIPFLALGSASPIMPLRA